jgi:hypothetical protein
MELPPFPPAGATLPDGTPITGAEISLTTDDDAQDVGPFWFCFLAGGEPWGDLPVYAPSPDDAQTSARRLGDLFRAALERGGYPPVTITTRAGRC